MKNMIKKISFFAIAFAFVLAATFSVCAAEYVQWRFTNDGSVLEGDGVEYYRYEAPRLVYENAKSVYRYEDTAENAINTDCYGQVSAPHADSDFVWVFNDYNEVVIFTKGDAAAEFDKFFAGEGVFRLVNSDLKVGDVGKDVVDMIVGTEGPNRTESVSELEKTPNYELTVFDNSRTFYYKVGRLFKLDGKYWYVDYDSLENQHFDADGEFSFRRGEVELALVNTEANDEIDRVVKNFKYVNADYTWEDYDPYYENVREQYEQPLSVFWTSYSILGFGIPMIIGVLFALMAKRKKLGKPKYFYSVSAACAAWIVFAGIVALMLAL